MQGCLLLTPKSGLRKRRYLLPLSDGLARRHRISGGTAGHPVARDLQFLRCQRTGRSTLH